MARPQSLALADESLLTELLERLPGLPVDQQVALKDRKLKASAHDLALDHAALLCGVPLYHYTLRHLETNQSPRSKRK